MAMVRFGQRGGWRRRDEAARMACIASCDGAGRRGMGDATRGAPLSAQLAARRMGLVRQGRVLSCRWAAFHRAADVRCGHIGSVGDDDGLR
ncbi:hypothetical protein E2562_026971 [Oryza meyeriana var. granulata]|uniref:Uncharacterized protein n=1 Tax=Oryza meyeriana var. granulata TaxID=110450 RepID=A0A6G1BYY3_9ORYZ|nr:hypothetical protein E2562_026971 [Oryza meyeriana var. granulata]